MGELGDLSNPYVHNLKQKNIPWLDHSADAQAGVQAFEMVRQIAAMSCRIKFLVWKSGDTFNAPQFIAILMGW